MPAEPTPALPAEPTPAPRADGEEPGLRLRRGPAARNLAALLTAVALAVAVNQTFNLQFFSGVVLLDNAYLYVIGGLFLSIVFIVFPPSAAPWARRCWPVDAVLALAALGLCLWLAAMAERNLNEGWEYAAPPDAAYASVALWLLILEGTRRTAGTLLCLLVLLFSLYPLVAGDMPGPIAGFSQPFDATIAFHILSSESSFGIPMNAFGGLVLGFVLFGAALQHTGGSAFFNNIAFAAVGGYRGGAAKVACLGSGLMGSVSGSVISNIMTTGTVSIPAMKRTGFSPSYAAGVEACASTGGVMMPPVMGTTAFVMASFLGVKYGAIVEAAIIPSLLYYFGLVVQIDGYAAQKGLRGLPRAELPRLGRTLAEGWPYILVFAVLVWMLVGLDQETIAPYVATLVLLVVNQAIPRTRLGLRGLKELLAAAGIALAEMVALLAGVGLIVGAFSVTGLSGTLANDLVFLAGGATLVLLAMGALTSFVFGMGMTVTSCYIFLAVVLAPSLTRAGLDPIAVHLFIMYWGMVSFITPPVALGAFAAAALAGTSPMRAGLSAMRLGSVIYVLPFFFVLEPALIGRGDAVTVALTTALAVVGVWLIASGLQGYLAGVGAMGRGVAGGVARLLLVAGGLVVALPATLVPGIGHLELAAVGLVPVAAAIAVARRAVPSPGLNRP